MCTSILRSYAVEGQFLHSWICEVDGQNRTKYPGNQHGTQKWSFGRWCSFSIGWFLRFHVNFRGCSTVQKFIGLVETVDLTHGLFPRELGHHWSEWWLPNSQQVNFAEARSNVRRKRIYIYIDRSIYLFWMMFAQYFQLGIFKIICYVDSSLCLYVCIEFLPIPIPNDVEGLASLVAEKLR